MPYTPITRRILLGGAIVSSAALALSRVAAEAASAPSRAMAHLKRPATTANGWPAQSRADEASTVWTRPVSGTGLKVQICVGVPEVLLVHVTRRIHYEIQPLLPGDLTGWRPDVGPEKGAESNLASGTAIHVRPGAATDSYFPLEVLALRDILADCAGTVRWGGDDRSPDQSLFYIDVPPDHVGLQELAETLRSAAETPGAGPGMTVPFLQPERRSRARAVARSQR